MHEAAGTQQVASEGLDARFLIRAFYAFAALAALSIAISIAGKWIGASLSMVGHSADRTVHEIVIGNNVLRVPANVMRFEGARRSGEAARLDMYFRWPDMEGYSREAQDDFNNRDGRRNIIFAAIEPAIMSRDMSGRLGPIYRRVIELPPRIGPAGLSEYDFRANTGYVNEMLVVGSRHEGSTFVARCLSGAAADESLAPCERDVHIGAGLSLIYRFPAQLLPQWATLDARIVGKVGEFLQKAK